VLIAVAAAAYHWKAFKLAENRWTLVVLIVPPLVYAAVAVASNLNIGIRHIFPIYPFVFVATGVGLSRLWKVPRWRFPLCFLGAMLIAETASAFPDYLAFFNVACRSQRLYLLSDSNLDWGQDLPLLAAWQKSHEDVPLYLDYFGSADPHDYGIRFVDVRHAAPAPPKGPGMLAVSATYLQLHEFNRAAFRKLGAKWRDPPEGNLGGTIYLYAIPSH
jgi:hypothetical protein